jgi:hypothetical protein
VPATVPLLLGVELIRADIAKAVLGLNLGDAPCGGPITWALFIDAALVGRTDEPMTDDAAQAWARRMTGDGVRFQLAHRLGGYWLADTAHVADRFDRHGAQGGWSR